MQVRPGVEMETEIGWPSQAASSLGVPGADTGRGARGCRESDVGPCSPWLWSGLTPMAAGTVKMRCRSQPPAVWVLGSPWGAYSWAGPLVYI